MSIDIDAPAVVFVGGITQDFAFVAADWAAGIANEIQIVRVPAVPGPGQIGPHVQPLSVSYLVQVYRDIGAGVLTKVSIQIDIDTITGLISLKKVAGALPFAGRVIVGGP